MSKKTDTKDRYEYVENILVKNNVHILAYKIEKNENDEKASIWIRVDPVISDQPVMK